MVRYLRRQSFLVTWEERALSIDTSLLSQVLTWFVSGGGAGIVAYFLMEKLRPLAELTSELKRYVSLLLAAVLAMAAFALAVGLRYVEAPTTIQAWAEALFAVAFIATNLGQIIHGRTRLRSPA